jgi:hypothetical protein
MEVHGTPGVHTLIVRECGGAVEAWLGTHVAVELPAVVDKGTIGAFPAHSMPLSGRARRRIAAFVAHPALIPISLSTSTSGVGPARRARPHLQLC